MRRRASSPASGVSLLLRATLSLVWPSGIAAMSRSVMSPFVSSGTAGGTVGGACASDLVSAGQTSGTVLAGGAVWFLLLGIWRYVSLASMLSLWVVALAFAALHAGPAPVAATVFLALMVLVRHRENVKRLLVGKEPRVGRPKTTMD